MLSCCHVVMVAVVRESNFTRSGTEELDEAEVFPGSGNNLTMTQTYTLEFQCEYKLQRYPFDTQVSTHYGCEVKRLKLALKNGCNQHQPHH